MFCGIKAVGGHKTKKLGNLNLSEVAEFFIFVLLLTAETFTSATDKSPPNLHYIADVATTSQS